MISANEQIRYKIITRTGTVVDRGFRNFGNAMLRLKQLRQTVAGDAIVVDFGTLAGKKRPNQRMAMSNSRHKRIQSTNTPASEIQPKK